MVARKYQIYFECEQGILYIVYFINGKRKFTWKVCVYV